MAEGKYGKLRPVEVREFDLPGGTHTVHEMVLAAKWDDDEPLFLLRGQDYLAPMMLELYASVADASGRPEVAQGVRAQLRTMRVWQVAHDERVKFPD